MSEMKRKKGWLQAVTNSECSWVNVENYLLGEYGVSIEQDVTQEEAYHVLCSFLEQEDLDNPYFLYDEVLYKLKYTKDIDVYGHVEARMPTREAIVVDCHWYNGGCDFRECVDEALVKLKKDYYGD